MRENETLDSVSLYKCLEKFASKNLIGLEEPSREHLEDPIPIKRRRRTFGGLGDRGLGPLGANGRGRGFVMGAIGRGRGRGRGGPVDRAPGDGGLGGIGRGRGR